MRSALINKTASEFYTSITESCNNEAIRQLYFCKCLELIKII